MIKRADVGTRGDKSVTARPVAGGKERTISTKATKGATVVEAIYPPKLSHTPPGLCREATSFCSSPSTRRSSPTACDTALSKTRSTRGSAPTRPFSSHSIRSNVSPSTAQRRWQVTRR